MNEKAIEVGIQQINPFQLLERVNSFYNDAWSKLLIFITIALFIIGVVVPYLIQLYQKRLFKIEKDRIKEDLKKDLSESVNTKFGELSLAIDKKLELSNKENQSNIAAAEAKTFHVQGAQMDRNKEYALALVSYLDSVTSYLRCDEGMNFRRALEGLKECLSNVSSGDMESTKDQGYDIDALLAEVAEKYKNGSYRDLILDIKKELKSANARK